MPGVYIFGFFDKVWFIVMINSHRMFEKLFRIKTFSVPFTTVSTSDKKKKEIE